MKRIILLLLVAFMLFGCDNGGKKKDADELKEQLPNDPQMPNEPNLVPPLPT